MAPEKPLKILFVTAELAPLVSTGGLADVAAALPKALRARGHDVRIVMPCYRAIPERHRGEHYCLCVAEMGGKTEYGAMRATTVPGTDIPLYLIEHEGYFGREHPYGTGAHEYPDNAERFCFLCLALLHAIPQTGWIPDVLHGHDWHTAMLPAYLKTRYADHPQWRGTPTVFTIHNMNHQGRYGADKLATTGLPKELFHPGCLEYEGDMNLMKAGLAFSEKINTVSPRYAREIQTLEYGAGLDGMLRARAKDLSGILNGVDYTLWDPATDPHIPANYTADDLSGKAACKRALQKTFGLPEKDVPIFGVVTRLYWQKGMDVLVPALDRMEDGHAQVVVLGSGDPGLEKYLWEASQRKPDSFRVTFKYDVNLSHLIQAGSDFFLMPSRYEPCGLTQMYCLAYGAIPVVRRTGGLADTVLDINPVNLRRGTATGISFVPLSVEALGAAIQRAIALYANPPLFKEIQVRGMKQDFSWDRSCTEYVALYQQAMAKAKAA